VSATWATFLFEAANFLLLAAVLGWIFFRPVRDALERRRAALESERRAAAQARGEAEQALERARAQRSELEGSLDELRQRVRREAEAERDKLLESARAQTQREREALKEELVSLRRGQVRALARDAALAARELVVRLLERMEGPDLEDALRRAAVYELEELRGAGALAPVVVDTAHELDEAALARLAEAAGVEPGELQQRVDSELVAGLRVLTARGLVDASAAGLAAQAERVLARRLEREEPRDG
jgi:F-type H+-transporting ATPase subunit b